MAQINLKVKSDFAQASKDLKNFGTITESEKARIEKYVSSFKSESVDKFIDANRRLGAGMQANKGDISAIIAQQKALESQSIKLIKNGLDPESAEVQKLTDEYNRLQKEYNDTKLASEGMEQASKNAQKALLGIGVATVATAGMFIKLASSVEMVEASFTPLLGSTEKAKELVEELNKTAATTPFQFENIAAASKQLLPVMNQDIQKTVDTFRMLGDTAGGNAQKLESITRGYTKAMLKNKVDMESLNMIAEAGVPIYTELAKSLNVSVAEMTKMSSAGKITSDDLTKAFEQMTAEGGLFFEGMEIASATAEGKLSTVKDIFTLIGATIGSYLLPIWKGFLDNLIETGNNILKFVQDGDKLKDTLKVVGLALAGVTAGLATFLILSKGAVAISMLSKAFMALNLAMKANPVIFIASAITAVLIPAIIYLVKNWDKVSIMIQTSVEILSQSFKMLGVDIKTGWTVAINALKLGWLSLGTIIIDKVLGGVQKFLELAGKIPFVGEKFKSLSNSVGDTRDEFNKLSLDARNSTLQVIKGAIDERNEIKATSDENIKNIKLEGKARLDALKVMEESSEEAKELVLENSKEVLNIVTADEQEKIDKIKDMNDKWVMSLLQQSEKKFEIMEIEKQKALEDAESIGADTTLIYTYYENEKARITKELADKEKADKLTAFKEEADLLNKRATNVGDFAKNIFSIQSSLLERETREKIKSLDDKQLSEKEYADAVTAIKKESAMKQWEVDKKTAIANKGIALVEIATNTAVGISKALAQGGIFGIVTGALVGIAGLAQAAAVIAEPLPAQPTFQTGTPMGGFEVPQRTGSSRADNTSIAVSPNEVVNVSPRGQGGQGQNIIVQIDRQVIFDIVTDGIESGDVRITADNIQSA